MTPRPSAAGAGRPAFTGQGKAVAQGAAPPPADLEWRGLAAAPARAGVAVVGGCPAVAGCTVAPQARPPQQKARGRRRLRESELAGSDQVVGDVAEFPVGRHRGARQQLEGRVGGELVALYQDALRLVDDRAE